jgi:anti-anti-sigma factor
MAKTIEHRLYGLVVVELKGKIDQATAEATERLLAEGAAGARHLVVDLSAVSYLNSAGLRLLVGAGSQLRTVGGQMFLCAVPSYIKEVLDVAGISSLYPVCASRAQAIAAAVEAR